MTAISAGIEDIIPENGVTIGPLGSALIVTGIYTNQSVTYIQGPTTTSDKYFIINTQAFSVSELTSSTQTPDLSCSFSGNSSIVYSLASSNGFNLTSIVSINSATGVLSITAPSVSVSSDYYFFINSAISGVSDPVQKMIKLTIKK